MFPAYIFPHKFFARVDLSFSEGFALGVLRRRPYSRETRIFSILDQILQYVKDRKYGLDKTINPTSFLYVYHDRYIPVFGTTVLVLLIY